MKHTTLKFLRQLADELGLSLDQLDDQATEYVLENVTYAVDIGVELYREYEMERLNP